MEGDDWLWFDESAKEAALHAWAAGAGASAELSKMSRAFLLREKLFACAEIRPPTTAESIRLTRALDGCGRENIDWLLDDPTFTSYKDYDAGFRAPRKTQDQGAVATGAILISGGEVFQQARPAEAASRVLEALGENPQGTRLSLCRLFFHRKLAEPIGKLLAELGLVSQ